VNLKLARAARDDAKQQKAGGADPLQARKLAKLKAVASESDTLKATALEWYGKDESRWSSH
jgi:hypothetical protein